MITNCHIFYFETDLLSIATKKKSFIFRLERASGQFSWGEVSPLDGRSKETLDEALSVLTQETQQLIGRTPEQALDAVLSNDTLPASVSFGLFGALLGFTPLEKSLSYPVSALLYGSYEEILRQIPYVKAKGFSHAKLKTAKLSAHQTKEIVDLLSDTVKLRIDVNAVSSKNDVLSFLQYFPKDHFDYIEDPYPLNEGLKDFSYPLGLDEVLSVSFSEDFLHLPTLKALVIKPSLMGVGPAMQRTLSLGIKKGLTISLSSSFETGIGLYQIARLADFFNLPTAPLGLDTYRFLSPDILLHRHTIANGRMSFSPLCPDMKYLSEVVYA